MRIIRSNQTIQSFLSFPSNQSFPSNPQKSEAPSTLVWRGLLEKEAATYSPALHCSTIGASGLNFSVRDGKRWDPAAITTWNGVDTYHKRTLESKISTKTCLEGPGALGPGNGKHPGRKVLGQLVALGFDVAVFTPAPYQRRGLRRPSMELSSCGRLRT